MILFFSTSNDRLECLVDRWVIFREIHKSCVYKNSYRCPLNTRSNTCIARLVSISIKECHLSTYTPSLNNCLKSYTSLRRIFINLKLSIHHNIECIRLITLSKECLMRCQSSLFTEERESSDIIRSKIAEKRMCFESITHRNYFLITSLYASNISPTSGFVSPLYEIPQSSHASISCTSRGPLLRFTISPDPTFLPSRIIRSLALFSSLPSLIPRPIICFSFAE